MVDSNGCFLNENPREVMIQQHLIKRMDYFFNRNQQQLWKGNMKSKKTGWFVSENLFLYKHVLSTVPVCFGGYIKLTKSSLDMFLIMR